MRKLPHIVVTMLVIFLCANTFAIAASPTAPSWLLSPGTIHYNSSHVPFALSSPYTEYMNGQIAPDGSCEYSAPAGIMAGDKAIGGYVVAVSPATCQYAIVIGNVPSSDLLVKPSSSSPVDASDPQQSGYVVSGWYTDTFGFVVNQVTDNISYAYTTDGDILSVSGSYSFNEGNFVVDGSVGYGPAGVGGTTAEYFTDVVFENASESGCYIYYRDAAALGSDTGVISSGTDSYSSGCGANDVWYFQANSYQ